MTDSHQSASHSSSLATGSAASAPPSQTGTPNAVAAELPQLEFPALYAAANAASLTGQQGYKWLVVADLGLLAIAAFVTMASQVDKNAATWSRAIAAALLALALLAKAVARMRSYDSQWFDGRAVAETVKSATWRYAMHAAPFTNAVGAHAAFTATLRETLQARPSLVPYLYQVPANGRQMTPEMEQIRAAPLAARKALYIEKRLADQIGWYAGRAASSTSSASRWFWVGIVAQGLALVVAIVLIERPELPDFVAALTTVAAAAAAWTQFRRHDELSKSYSLAAHELAFLRSEVESSTGEESFRKAVAATEDAISREHTMWMAKRS